MTGAPVYVGVVTADEGRRGGRPVKLKEVVDAALRGDPLAGRAPLSVRRVLVFRRTGASVSLEPGRDLRMEDLLAAAEQFAPVPMPSEAPLFVLYTSGSTGRPKGVVHATAGYLLGAALSTVASFDLQETDVFCCVADCGWITGHSVSLCPTYCTLLYVIYTDLYCTVRCSTWCTGRCVRARPRSCSRACPPTPRRTGTGTWCSATA